MQKNSFTLCNKLVLFKYFQFDLKIYIKCNIGKKKYLLTPGPLTTSLKTKQAMLSDVGKVNIWEVPGYRIEMSPFGGIKDSGNGIKEGVQEAMKCFTNVKTFSLPWTN